MPRRLNIELVATGSQQVNQLLKSYSRQYEAFAYQQDAISRAAIGYQNKLFPTQGVTVFDSKVKEATRDALGLGQALKLLNEFGPVGPVGTGFQVGPMKQQLSTIGNTIKVTNEGVLSLGQGLDVLGTKTIDYTGDVNKIFEAQNNFRVELEASIPNIEKAGIAIDKLTAKYQPLIAAQVKAAESASARKDIATERLANISKPLDINSADYKIKLNTSTERIKQLQALVNQERERTRLSALGKNYDEGKSPYYLTAPTPATPGHSLGSPGITMQQFLQENPAGHASFVALQEKELADAIQQRTLLTLNTTKEFANASKQLNRAEEDLTKATRSATGLRAALTRQIRAIGKPVEGLTEDIITRGNASVQAAYNAPPPLPPQIQTIREQSPALLRKLQQAGLGGGAAVGTQEFTNNLINQKAYESINIQKDLVRQVTRVTGSFIGEKNVVESFSAEYDKAGKVLTRFGSNLSGIGNVLNQLGRDFQKVIEFAVATTVVFGGFQYAIKEIETIRELDKSIRQLSITANLTRTDSISLFQDIADVAISTATPLKELVKATDDIALATRRAGQSSAEWRREIISLTQSVGILTNLAGIDTVDATDQLVSTMKQLNIQANQLPSILNKVTAVAGGQSNAIADIVKGLGVMSQASLQAGLSVDQMIATIQTLSQVTSKSPAEVATAFKNLIGSLEGPAGVKALDKYNIALKDGAGNLRNIIDIYSEIADKISKGVIPEADVQALIRAISGGPRRAPDAAALLGSIGDIQTVTKKSLNATNEALIANAKILDTTNAKFTQLQARIDKFATTKFAGVLNESVEGLTKVLDKLLTLLEVIPTNIYLLVIQFGLLAAAMKFGITTGLYFKNSIQNMIGSLVQLKVSLLEAKNNYQQFATSIKTSPILGTNGLPIVTTVKTAIEKQSPLRRIAGPAAIGVAGAGAAAISGASPLSAIGTGLESAGIGALTLPEPGISKAAAGALLGVGFVLQFLDSQTKQTTKDTKENTESILNAIDAYKTASEVITGLHEKQATLSESIARLQGIQNKSLAQNKQLLSDQQDYAANAAQQVVANESLAESFSKLNKTLEGSDFQSFKYTAARAGVYSQDQLKELTQQLAPKILGATNPNFVAPTDLKKYLPDLSVGQFAPTEGTTQATAFPRVGTKNEARAFDLSSLTTNAGDVKKLFDFVDQSFTAQLVPTYDNLQLIDTALKSIQKDLDPAVFAKYEASFQDYAAKNNALFAAERNVALYISYLQAGAATGLFKQEDVDRGTAIVNLYQELVNSIPIAQQRAQQGLGGIDSRQSAQGAEDVRTQSESVVDKFKKYALSKEDIPVDVAVEFGKQLLANTGQLDDLNKKGLTLKTIAELFKNAKIEVKGLTDNVKILGAASSESLLQFQEDLDTLNNDTLKNSAQKLGELQAQFQSGGFLGKEGDFYKQRDALEATITSVGNVSKAWEDATNNIAGLDISVLSLEPGLTKINGLQDAQTLSAGELFKRIFDLAGVYNLNSTEVLKLADSFSVLLKAYDDLNQNRTNEPTLNLSLKPDEQLAQLKAARETYLSSAKESGVNPDSSIVTRFNAEIATAQLAADAIKSWDSVVAGSFLGTKELPTDDKLQSALQSIAKNYADAQQQILVSKNSGQYDKDAAGLKKITSAAKETFKAETDLAKASSTLSDDGLQNLATALSQVNGLYDLSTLSLSDLKAGQDTFTTTLIDNAKAAGVNAEGLDKIRQEALLLIDTINHLPTYHEIIVEIKTITTNLDAVDSLVASGQTFSMGQIAEIQRQKALLAQAIKDKATFEAATKRFSTNVNQIQKTGNLRTPSKSGGGPDVSTLDLPDQIAASRNRSTIVQQAIRNARALQNQIPGANKAASNDIVELLAGTKRVTEVRGVKEDLLRKALEELTTTVKENTLQVSNIDLPDQIASASNRSALIQEAIKRATALQKLIPGETAGASNDVVELLKGTQRVLEVRGVKDDYLRKALEELADIEKKRLDFETKADTIRRIRVAGADFSAIANVPVNAQTGVSLGGSQGPINITLNLNGTVLTPAQFGQFANLVASSLKRQIALG